MISSTLMNYKHTVKEDKRGNAEHVQMRIISRCDSKSEPGLTVLFNRELTTVSDTIVYHNRDVNEDINSRLLDEMCEESQMTEVLYQSPVLILGGVTLLRSHGNR